MISIIKIVSLLLCSKQDFRVGKTRTIHSVMSTVENNMKKQTDNIMRFLEGISSRLSQLELHCYNLDKSIGEMRSDIGRGHEESDSKLKSLDKHVQEVCSHYLHFACFTSFVDEILDLFFVMLVQQMCEFIFYSFLPSYFTLLFCCLVISSIILFVLRARRTFSNATKG